MAGDAEEIVVLAAAVLAADTVVEMEVGVLKTVAVVAGPATSIQHYVHARESYQITALGLTLD